MVLLVFLFASDLPLNVGKLTSLRDSEAPEEAIQDEHSATVNYYEVQVVQTVTESDNETTDYDGEALLSNLIDTSQIVENDDSGNVEVEMMANGDVFVSSQESNVHRTNTLLTDSVSDSYTDDASVKRSNAEVVSADLMGSGHQKNECMYSHSENKHISENHLYNNVDKSTQFDAMQSDSEYKQQNSEFNDDHLDLDEKVQLCTIKEFNDLQGDPFENTGIITKKNKLNNSPRKDTMKRHQKNDTLSKKDKNNLFPVKQKSDASPVKRRTRQNRIDKDEKKGKNRKDDANVSEETDGANLEANGAVKDVVDKVNEEAKVSEEKDKWMKESLDSEEKKQTEMEVKVRKSQPLGSKKGKKKLKQLNGSRKKVTNSQDNSNKKISQSIVSSKRMESGIVSGDNNEIKKTVDSPDDSDENTDEENIEKVEKNSGEKIKMPTMEEYRKMVSIWAAEQDDPQRSMADVLYGQFLRPVDRPADLDSDFFSAAYSGWYCLNCSLLFKNRMKFMQHRLKTDGKCFHQCDICGKKYMIRSEMNTHRKYHDKDHKPYACHLCNGRYRRQNMLNNHIKQHHLDHNSYMCYQCGKQFKIRPCLLRHLQYAHIQDSDRMALCSQCPKKFKTVHDLKAHLLTHTSDLAWSCDICSKEFKTKKYMREHRKIHFAQRDQICETCGKGFFKLEHLKNHKLLHTGEKPYACSICSYKCTVKCNLDKHMKTHTHSKTVTALNMKAQKGKKSMIEYRDVDNFVGLPFKNNVQVTNAEINLIKNEGDYGNVIEYKNEPYSIPGPHIDSSPHNSFTSVMQHDYHHQLNMSTMHGQSS